MVSISNWLCAIAILLFAATVVQSQVPESTTKPPFTANDQCKWDFAFLFVCFLHFKSAALLKFVLEQLNIIQQSSVVKFKWAIRINNLKRYTTNEIRIGSEYLSEYCVNEIPNKSIISRTKTLYLFSMCWVLERDAMHAFNYCLGFEAWCRDTPKSQRWRFVTWKLFAFVRIFNWFKDLNGLPSCVHCTLWPLRSLLFVYI